MRSWRKRNESPLTIARDRFASEECDAGSPVGLEEIGVLLVPFAKSDAGFR